MASSIRPFPDYFEHLLLTSFIETLGGHVLTYLSKLNGSFSLFHSCILPGVAGPLLSLYMSPLILSSHSDQQPLDLADCKSMKKSIWCVLSLSAWTADCSNNLGPSRRRYSPSSHLLYSLISFHLWLQVQLPSANLKNVCRRTADISRAILNSSV